MVLHRVITADFVAAGALRNEILALAEGMGLNGEGLFEAKLSVEEALVDAIKRRRSSSALPVRLSVQAEITALGVTMTVTDAE